MNRKFREAFTLIELSVVVVILSILIATVMVSRNLVDGAKINKIQEDYRALRSAVTMFYDAYSCLPGDCNEKQVHDLVGQGLSTGCTSNVHTPGSVTMILNNGHIDSTAKRTCMMHSMQLAGYIGSDINVSTNQDLTASISGRTIPYAKFDKRASWDFRVVTGDTANAATSMFTMPIEAGVGGLASWNKEHMLILRNSNLNAVLLGSSGTPATTDANGDPVAAVPAATGKTYDIAVTDMAENTGAGYAITAVMAGKLDTKFDDGQPLSGNIIAGRLAANFADTAASSCHNNATGTAGVADAATYLREKDMNKSCIVAYKVAIGA